MICLVGTSLYAQIAEQKARAWAVCRGATLPLLVPAQLVGTRGRPAPTHECLCARGWDPSRIIAASVATQSRPIPCSRPRSTRQRAADAVHHLDRVRIGLFFGGHCCRGEPAIVVVCAACAAQGQPLRSSIADINEHSVCTAFKRVPSA